MNNNSSISPETRWVTARPMKGWPGSCRPWRRFPATDGGGKPGESASSEIVSMTYGNPGGCGTVNVGPFGTQHGAPFPKQLEPDGRPNDVTTIMLHYLSRCV